MPHPSIRTKSVVALASAAVVAAAIDVNLGVLNFDNFSKHSCQGFLELLGYYLTDGKPKFQLKPAVQLRGLSTY